MIRLLLMSGSNRRSLILYLRPLLLAVIELVGRGWVEGVGGP